MPSNYPTSLDALPNPAPTDFLNDPDNPHAEQHINANDAIEALQATVGTAASPNFIPVTQKGAANGVATLDGTGKLTAAQLDPVGTAQIADGSVTAAKVAADVATQAELDAVAAQIVTGVPAASIPIIQPAIGEYAGTPHNTRTAGTLDANMRATPFWVPVQTTYDRIGAELVTAAGTAATLRIGVASNLATGAELINGSGVTVNGTGGIGTLTVTINLTLTPGLYWLLSETQGVDAALPTWRRMSAAPYSIPSPTPGGTSVGLARMRAGGGGAFANPLAFSTLTSSVAPLVWLRRSA